MIQVRFCLWDRHSEIFSVAFVDVPPSREVEALAKSREVIVRQILCQLLLRSCSVPVYLRVVCIIIGILRMCLCVGKYISVRAGM